MGTNRLSTWACHARLDWLLGPILILAMVLIATSPPASAQNYVTPTGEALSAEIKGAEEVLAYQVEHGDAQSERLQSFFVANLYMARASEDALEARPGSDLDRAIKLYRRTIQLAAAVDPSSKSAMEGLQLSKALLIRSRGTAGADFDESLAVARQLYSIVSPEDDYFDWPNVATHLFRVLQASPRPEHIEDAVTLGEDAIVRGGGQMMLPWVGGNIKTVLADAYRRRTKGSVVENRDRAIALYQDVLATMSTDSKYAELRRSVETVLAGFDPNASKTTVVTQDDAAQCKDVIARSAAAESTQGLTANLPRVLAGIDACKNALAGAPTFETWAFHSALATSYVQLADLVPRDEGQAKYQLALEQADNALAALPVDAPPAFRAQMATMRMVVAQEASGIRADLDPEGTALAHGTLMERITMSYPIVARRLELGDFAGARTSVDEIFGDIRSKIGVGLDEREISEVLAGADRLQRLGVIAMLETGGAATALDFYDGARAQALAASMRMDLLDLSEADRIKLSNLRVQIAEDALRLEAAPQRTKKAIDALAKLQREAETLVAKGGEILPERSDIVTIAPVASPLGVHLFARTADGATLSVLVPELPINLLEKYAEDWVRTQREAIDTKTVDGGLRATDLSLRPLTDGIRALLDQAGVQSGAQIALLPDGAMGSLPLQLLSGSAGRPLIDDYEIIVTPSLATLSLSRRRAAPSQDASLIAFANPSGDTALPFSSIEIDLLAKSFAGSDVRILKEGPTAVSDAAAALVALRGRKYWHFSTHGEFDWENPNNSSLFLARGGRLRVGEIKIGAGALGTPRLVVLAACETGLADARRAPNEFNGLPIAFLQAGAAGVIASNWTVSDLSSAVLIARMYELHLGPAHLEASSALRQAQLWLRDADRQELEAFLESRQNDLSPGQSELLMGAFLDLPGERPFADPYHWGAWSYYGG